jgi:hypothetical protein
MSHLAAPASSPQKAGKPTAEVSTVAVLLTVLAVFGMVVVILAYAARQGAQRDPEALAEEARAAVEGGQAEQARVIEVAVE